MCNDVLFNRLRMIIFKARPHHFFPVKRLESNGGELCYSCLIALDMSLHASEDTLC